MGTVLYKPNKPVVKIPQYNLSTLALNSKSCVPMGFSHTYAAAVNVHVLSQYGGNWFNTIWTPSGWFQSKAIFLYITLDSVKPYSLIKFYTMWNLTGVNERKYPRSIKMQTWNGSAWETHGTVAVSNYATKTLVNVPFIIPKRKKHRYIFSSAPPNVLNDSWATKPWSVANVPYLHYDSPQILLNGDGYIGVQYFDPLVEY